MRPILVLCPTVGRPDWARAMFETFRETATLPSTRLLLVCERTDPEFAAYIGVPPDPALMRFGWDPDRPWLIGLEPGEGGTLVRATNAAAQRFWDRDVILGHVGDDHRFETTGWDRAITEALEQPGVAYGNDGHWGEEVATAPFVSAEIPRALGWLALPSCTHNGWDNAVMDLGRAIGSLHYLPDVSIAHPDPAHRRTSNDPGYRRARSHQNADKAALRAWRRGEQGRLDIARLVQALGKVAAA